MIGVMAEKTIKVCDRCAADDEDTSAVTTREFPYGKDELELDLCAKHNSELDRLLESFESWKEWARPKKKASRSRNRSRSRTPAAAGADPAPAPEPPERPELPVPAAPAAQSEDVAAAARAWARSKGMTVADRGRLSPEIIAAYEREREPVPAS